MLAKLTLDAIARAIESDQGGRFRELQAKYLPQMADAYRGAEEGHRSHLGASLIGRACERELWYGFRWAKKKRFDARILRLFNRGHLEEGRFLALLDMIGCAIWSSDADGNQYRIKDVHFGSALDCVVKGIPDMPDTVMLGEFKTHNSKSFTKLKEMTVVNSKPEHFAQMQACMGHTRLPYTIYMAVNKDTDELYAEIVAFQPAVFERIKEKYNRIIYSDFPPKRISERSTDAGCRMCDFHSICFGGKAMERNCRTCVYSVPMQTVPNWYCSLHDETIPKEKMQGCGKYKPKEG